MAINERLVHTASAAAAAGGGTGNQEEGLVLHLDANDVDSYDGDGTEWVDIANYEYTPATNVSEHFNTVTWTGDNASTRKITGVGFQPDLVWYKTRSHAIHHNLYDSIRGVGTSSVKKALFPASTAGHAQGDGTVYGYLSQFDVDGFDVSKGSHANQTDANTYVNWSGRTYVAWCFKAGGAPSGSDKVSIDGTSYTNEAAAGLTAGNVAVTKLSANTKLGFSIATLDNVATSPNKTFSHGLGVAPEMVIGKIYDGTTDNWHVMLPSLGANNEMFLNTTDDIQAWSGFNNTAPNSNVVNLAWTTSSAYKMVFYSFASKRGVSKVGSYTGNGSTNGPKIYTGFEPAFLMFKCTSQVGNWIIVDNKRATSNPRTPHLRANSTSEDDTGANEYVDFLSDGFRPKGVSNYNNNSSGQTYIYYAVAKNTNETELNDGLGFKPSIDPDDHFNTVLYNGTGSSVTLDAGFAPDLVWLKRRDNGAASYTLVDTLRGANSRMFSDTTGASITNGSFAFNSNGTFQTNNVATQSKASSNHVAWCFKAGGVPSGSDTVSIDGTSYADEAAAGLTAGDAPVAKLSANTELGFSVATIDNEAGAFTFSHGLGVAPELVILKRTDVSGDWYVYSENTGKDKYLKLNSTSQALTSTAIWQNTSPTSSLVNINLSGDSYDYVFYSFASKEGVSKVGSYTGTQGTIDIDTGFEPAFVMIKWTSGSIGYGSWGIYDNKRDTTSPNSKFLVPNTNVTEYDYATYSITMTSTGFTVGSSQNDLINYNGNNYIYYAVAKNTNNEPSPLKINLDAASFDGSTNTPSTWTDSTSNSNDGTISGATFDAELGNWLDFDGSNDYVQITPIPSTLQNDAIVTGEVWICPKTATYNSIISFRGVSGTSIKFFLAADSSSRLYFVSSSVSSYLVFGTTASNVVPVNKWTHVVATINYTTKDYYIYANGELVSSGNQNNIKGAGTFNAANFFVGTNLIGVQHSNLKIGQARIYNKELSQAQIRQNYNFTKPSYPNGNNGTLVSMGSSEWDPSGYFDFDGASDYVNLNNLVSSFFNNAYNKPFSVSMWFNPDNLPTSSTPMTLWYFGQWSTGVVRAFLLNTGAVNFQSTQGGSTTVNQLNSSGTYSVNNWNHLVCVFDGTSKHLYLNNSTPDSVVHNYDIDTNLGAIGTDDSTLYDFNGQISDFKVYDKALTSDEVAAQFAIKQFDIG